MSLSYTRSLVFGGGGSFFSLLFFRARILCFVSVIYMLIYLCKRKRFRRASRIKIEGAT